MPVLAQMRGVRLLSAEAKLVVALEGRARVFIKVSEAGSRKERSELRRRFEREKAALDALQGLVVPQAFELPQRTQRRLFGERPTIHVAQSYVSGEPITQMGLSPLEIVGAWLFVAEQLAAFRRRQIVYSDIKPDHLIGRRSPLRMTLIDLGCTTLVAKSRRYFNDGRIAFTPGYQAPEHMYVRYVDESVVVYQLCMLLGAALVGLYSTRLDDPQHGRGSLFRKLTRIGAAGMVGAIKAGLSAQPRERPRDYEELFHRVGRPARSEGLPAEALRAWRMLRAPFAGPLEDLGFGP